MSTGQQQAVGIFALIAVVALAYVLITRKTDEGVACAATSAGVALVADGLRKHESAAGIIAGASAEFILVDKCESWVNTLVNDPTKQSKLRVEDGSQAATATTSGADLVTPATPPPSSAESIIQRGIACRGWTIDVFFRDCLDYKLDPLPTSN